MNRRLTQPDTGKGNPYFATLAEQVNVGVYLREVSGHLIYANAALSELSGYTREELGRMRLRELYELPDSEFQRQLENSHNTFLVRGEQKLRHKNGQLLPVEVEACFLGSDLVSTVVRAAGAPGGVGHKPHTIADLFTVMFREISDQMFSLSVEPGDRYRFRFANLAFYRAAALDTRQVIGKCLQEVLPEPALGRHIEHIHKAIREKCTVFWDEVRESRTGLCYGQARITPVFNACGECTELVGRVRDVTAIREQELSLRRQRDLYAMLSQTNQAIVHLHERRELFEAICRIAVQYAHLQFAAVSLLDPRSRELRVAAKYGQDADYLQLAQIFATPSDVRGFGPAGEAVLTGRSAICNDFLADGRTQPWWELARTAGIRASAAFPLRQAGAIIGVLSLYANAKDYFAEDLLPTLSEIAGDLSFALDNYAREAERRELAQQRDEVFKRIADGFLALDRSWNLTYLNTAGCQLLKGEPATLLGKNVWRVLPAKIGSQLRERFQISMVMQKPAEFEEYFEGWKKWYAIQSYPSRDGLTLYFRDISERKRLQQEEQQHRAEINRISQRLLEVQESERRNLARELHDEVGQCFAAVLMKLRELDRLTEDPAVRQLLAETSGIVTDLDERVGQVSLDLHPAVLDDLGLAAALRWCVRTRFGTAAAQIQLTIEPELPRFADSLERAVFRVFQESLSNAVKYSGATRIRVTLARSGEHELRLRVVDDGRGFDLAAALQAARAGKSLGLLGMQERAEFLGGQLAIDSAAGRGTTVQLTLPATAR